MQKWGRAVVVVLFFTNKLHAKDSSFGLETAGNFQLKLY